ncbi:MAG: histidine kinase [Chitinophagaceae bacterium]|nr:histidine kinase [Chitinophagaceae bacterium]
MTTSPLETARNRWIFAACWILWTAVHYMMLQNFDIEWDIALADSIGSNVLLAGASILIINSLSFYRPEKSKYFYLLAWCLVVTLICTWIIKISLQNIFSDDAVYINFLMKSMPVRFDIAFLVIGCSIITGMLWFSLEEKKAQEIIKQDAEKLARDAELYKLRQQLQPHFLFNSLNSISALAGKQPEQARKMIQQLSDFLRGALKKEDHQWITLADELQHLELYLDMEKMRFGHRLDAQIVTDEACLKAVLPPMLLQPIVENAIKFGLYDTTEAITINITAKTTKDYLEITVQNPYDPETSSPKTGTGFGLSSVQRRLYLLFARNDLLTTSTDQRIFSTTVKIPINDPGNINR